MIKIMRCKWCGKPTKHVQISVFPVIWKCLECGESEEEKQKQ